MEFRSKNKKNKKPKKTKKPKNQKTKKPKNVNLQRMRTIFENRIVSYTTVICYMYDKHVRIDQHLTCMDSQTNSRSWLLHPKMKITLQWVTLR